MKNQNKIPINSQNGENRSFLDLLNLILNEAKISDEIEIKQIFSILSGKGYPSLLVILSLPFCIPIQIPGFSTPFGLILAFLGLRICFFNSPLWPKSILDKKIKSQKIEHLTRKTIEIVKKMQKITHPRLTILTKNPILHRLHGLLIFALAIFLSLPLPIPMTNMLAALPIFCLGIGLLEDDGVFILIGYLFGMICFSLLISLIIKLISQLHLIIKMPFFYDLF